MLKGCLLVFFVDAKGGVDLDPELAGTFTHLTLGLNVSPIVVATYIIFLHALDSTPSLILLPLSQKNCSHQTRSNDPLDFELVKSATWPYCHIFCKPTVLTRQLPFHSGRPLTSCVRKGITSTSHPHPLLELLLGHRRRFFRPNTGSGRCKRFTFVMVGCFLPDPLLLHASSIFFLRNRRS